MSRVRSFSLAGKSVNVPHSEFREDVERNSVTFDADGYAEVSDTLADALLEFYPKEIESAKKAPAKASA